MVLDNSHILILWLVDGPTTIWFDVTLLHLLSHERTQHVTIDTLEISRRDVNPTAYVAIAVGSP